MYHRIVLAVAMLGCAAASFASTISGSLAYVSGTLTSNLTVSNSAITLTLKVGTTTTSFANTFVAGTPGTVLPTGTAIEMIKQSSNPFVATFTKTSIKAFVGSPLPGLTGARTVPISTAGVLGANIAFAPTIYGGAISFYYPNFTIGTFSFPNGMSMTLGSEISTYSVTLPTTTTPTTSLVNFPVAEFPEYIFQFSAAGTAELNMIAVSTLNTTTVAGTVVGTGTVFTEVTFRLTSSGTF